MTTVVRDGLPVSIEKQREWQRRGRIKYAERLRAKGRKQLPRVSKSRAAEERIYSIRSKVFLEANPICQFPSGCHRRGTTVHHRRGRVGSRYLDERWWASSCVEHNLFAEDHTGEALAIGWLLPQFGRLPDDEGSASRYLQVIVGVWVVAFAVGYLAGYASASPHKSADGLPPARPTVAALRTVAALPSGSPSRDGDRSLARLTLSTTAYCSTGDRTASGVWPRRGMAASNLFPFGTRLRVPGVGLVTVTDRIGWGADLDIYLGAAGCDHRALTFGRRSLTVEVVGR